MRLWQDGLVAALAAVGLASIFWTVVRTILFAPPPQRWRTAVLISAQGDGAYLEDQVRTLERLGRDRGVFGRVLIVDCGLTEEGRRLARLLAREDRGVGLCGPDEVERYLIQ